MLLSVLPFLLSSCGVMFGGGRYIGSIVVKEHPSASITVNGTALGRGSVIGHFKRNRTLLVEVQEPGCEKQVMVYDYRFRTGNFVLSALTWGLAGVIIDLATGACFEPLHRVQPGVEKLSMKNFLFTIDYRKCPKSFSASHQSHD